MKVFIVSDIEGVSGVTKPGQTIGGAPMYEESRRLYTEEINAAVRGAKAAGATEIVVMDCHGAGDEWDFNSLIPELLDEACDFVVQDEWTEYTAFLESGADAALFVGMHADGRDAPRRDEPHRLGPGLAEPLVQRRPRRRDRDQRGALRQLGLPGADGHGRRRRLRRGARPARPRRCSPSPSSRGFGAQSARNIAPLRARALIEDGARQALADLTAVEPYLPGQPVRDPGRVQEHARTGCAPPPAGRRARSATG